ncbi:hypothetical protein [Arthrobacter cryoconiti]|uniref:Uncharacterized protein n=1 Tax=Arthrobacter cryoconiti TaxID=748907 RepID=A0ABV8R4A1_9MICC|nr:hypothetical protein [Arthrobacter cryoconiti]MCC9069380.1 hypothetical protein [Arthrobacter cryoconiti]
MKQHLPGDDAAKNYRHHRRLVRVGQGIMVLGALVGLSHWLAHVALPGGPPGIQDLLIGYPTAAAVLIVGAVLAGRTTPKKR